MTAWCCPLGTFGRGPADHVGGRHRDDAWGVGDVIVTSAFERGEVDVGVLVFFGNDRAPVDAVLLYRFFQFVENDRALTLLAGQKLLGVGDHRLKFRCPVLELLDLERDESPQGHVEHMGGLQLGQIELGHQRLLGVGGRLRCPDDLNDLVDVVERNEKADQDVQFVFPLRQAVLGAADNDFEAVPNVMVAEVPQAHSGRDAIDEDDVVDAEGLFERGELVEVGEHGL